MDPFGEDCSYRNPYRSSSCETTYGAPGIPYPPKPRMTESTLKGGRRIRNKTKRNKNRKRSRR